MRPESSSSGGGGGRGGSGGGPEIESSSSVNASAASISSSSSPSPSGKRSRDLEDEVISSGILWDIGDVAAHFSLRQNAAQLRPDLDRSEPRREAISQYLHSTSPVVVDQSVRELCSLVTDSKIDISRGFLEL
ncbi:hypothetical protein ACFX1X_022884 [Malus domestica]